MRESSECLGTEGNLYVSGGEGEEEGNREREG